jgi:hypothetical protein
MQWSICSTHAQVLRVSEALITPPHEYQQRRETHLLDVSEELFRLVQQLDDERVMREVLRAHDVAHKRVARGQPRGLKKKEERSVEGKAIVNDSGLVPTLSCFFRRLEKPQ